MKQLTGMIEFESLVVWVCSEAVKQREGRGGQGHGGGHLGN